MPFLIKKYNSENKPILPIIAMSALLSALVLPSLCVLLMYFGNLTIRIFLLLLLFVQYFILEKKNHFFYKFLKFCRIHEYFNSYTLIIEEKVASSKALIACHPHGIYSIGLGLAMMSDVNLFENFTFLGTRLGRYTPFAGIIFRLLGLEGVNNKNFKGLMRKGKNFCFVPGGFESACITHYKKEREYLLKRKGFIKYALQHGYTLYPAYSFNESHLFYTLNFLEKFRLKLTKFKLPSWISFGLLYFYPLRNRDIITVIGNAISFPQIDNPNQEQIDYYHFLYIGELKKLFNKYKEKLNLKEDLEII